MRILIIGGFGFIGGRLSAYLNRGGHQILMGTSKNRVAPSWMPGAQIRILNLYDVISIENTCENIDVIVYAHGLNSADCKKNPDLAFKNKKIEIDNLIKISRAKKIKKIIYISTAHVYGEPLVGDISEISNVENLHPYAVTHLIAEKELLDSGVNAVIIRLSNAYGYPMDKTVNCWHLLVNDLCRQVVTLGTINLYTSGQQERNFISLSEVCRVIKILIETDQEGMKIFNLGSKNSLTVTGMAKLIQCRSKKIFNINADLIKKMDLNSIYQPLCYESLNLKKLGIKIKPIGVQEIDSLLRYCANQLSK